jgi:uncharacterized protein (TIGR02246 family)
MPEATGRTGGHEEAEIRALVDGWTRAVRERNVEAMMAHYAPGVVAFDVVDPLRYEGVESLRQRARTWIDSFAGPIAYELRDLTIHAAEGVAFCHSLNHVSARRKDGRGVDMWWRATVGLVKRDGGWMVAHAHSSVPFDPDTGAASLDLEP